MSSSWKERFLVIAHRGASAYEPENTLKAFRRAIEMGADAIELDVRRTKDGVPVVVHDEDLKRIAGIEKKVNELTLEELKNVKVMGTEPIPTLRDVLAELGGRITMFIELKEVGLEEEVVKLLKEFKVLDSVLVISFEYQALSHVKELEPSIEIGLLTYRHPLPIREALKLKAFAILPRYNLVTPMTVKEIHSKKLKVYTWTINDSSLALRMIGYGVDGFATDRPDIKSSISKQQTLLKYRHM